VKHCKKIAFLDISCNFFSPQALEKIIHSYADTLKVLKLEACSAGSHIAKAISTLSKPMSQLEAIYMENESGSAGSLDDSAFKMLNTCDYKTKVPKLKQFHFTLNDENADKETWEELRTFMEENKTMYKMTVNAQRLKLAANIFKNASTKMHCLEELQFVSGDEDAASILSAIPNLKILKLFGTTRATLLGELNQIEELHVELFKDSKSVFQQLCDEATVNTRFKNLKKLNLDCFTADVLAFKHLDRLYKLRPNLELAIRMESMAKNSEAQQHEQLLTCRNIVELKLPFIMVKNEYLKAIAKNTWLKTYC